MIKNILLFWETIYTSFELPILFLQCSLNIIIFVTFSQFTIRIALFLFLLDFLLNPKKKYKIHSYCIFYSGQPHSTINKPNLCIAHNLCSNVILNYNLYL